MTEKNFEREILVSASPQAAYSALTTDFDKWWATFKGDASKIGNRITFQFAPDPTFWTMQITKLVPNQMVELECIEANHIIEGLSESIKEEWLGTKLKWEIKPNQEGVEVSFVHEGLTPTLECYEICETGWENFFVNSLQDYLNGKGGSPVKAYSVN